MITVITLNTNIYAGREVQNQLVKPQLTVYDRLANMIVNGNSGDSEGVEALGKAVNLYRSCMDAATVESLGATPLLNLTRDSLSPLHACIQECNLN